MTRRLLTNARQDVYPPGVEPESFNAETGVAAGHTAKLLRAVAGPPPQRGPTLELHATMLHHVLSDMLKSVPYKCEDFGPAFLAEVSCYPLS